MSPLNAAICTTISYTLWVECYYLKNNYLTLRSKVKVPRRSLWYATHRLMVMHPHTKHNWLTWYLERQKSYGPDKLRWEEAEVEEKIRLKQYVSLRSKRRHNNKYLLIYLKNLMINFQANCSHYQTCLQDLWFCPLVWYCYCSCHYYH